MPHTEHWTAVSSYVRIKNVVLKTYLGRWTIGRSGERLGHISCAHRDLYEWRTQSMPMWTDGPVIDLFLLRRLPTSGSTFLVRNGNFIICLDKVVTVTLPHLTKFTYLTATFNRDFGWPLNFRINYIVFTDKNSWIITKSLLFSIKYANK